MQRSGSIPALESVDDLFSAARAAEQAARWDDALVAYHAILSRLPETDAERRAEVLRRSASVHYYRGDFERAAALADASCETASAAGCVRQLASALNMRATVHQVLGQLDDAEAIYLRALALAEEAGHSRLSIMVNQNLGTVASVRGDSDSALARYASALDRYEATGDLEGATWVLNNMGMVHVHLRAWDEAERMFVRALQVAEQRGDSEMVGTIQLNRADLYLKQERYDDARACADQGFEIFGMLDSRYGLGEAYKLYGMMFRGAGKPQLAEAHLSIVVELAHKADYKLLEAEALAEHALVFLDLGQNREALHALNRAHRRFTELQAARELLDIDDRLDGLERSYLQVVAAWGESIESKDTYTAGHSSRVAELTCRLAAALGFEGRELTWIRMGAYLHDVGKIAVDSAILRKAGKLTDEEWTQMKSHTVAGDDIVGDLDFPYDIRPLVRSHHEHWDGRGYPDGLAGEDIPLPARILCVADVFDALTTTRSYRPAYSVPQAIEIMRREAGTTLDPTLFDLFVDVLRPELGGRRGKAIAR
jgi:putative nucleotidyltransferase with HDIG domain